MSLAEHDGSYSISLDGKELMHSRANASELLLGSLGVARLGNETSGRILIGGLGLGCEKARKKSAREKKNALLQQSLLSDKPPGWQEI